jgi:hypothetical protein
MTDDEAERTIDYIYNLLINKDVFALSDRGST